jgi:sugar/nucleoside kinase (ribokinase family)
VIALLGNLSRDFIEGQGPQPGGAPFHAARALRHLDVRAELYACCALEDREELVLPVARLGTPVRYVQGTSTATFRISYGGGQRSLAVEAVGDTWTPDGVPQLRDGVRSVHLAPLVRLDFPAETIARIARGRRVLLDGRGLVRAPKLGNVQLDSDYDPAVLEHVQVLKLADEEAEVLGDVAALPVPEVVVTHGARGATIYVAGLATRVPAFALPADPTGAGDAFAIAYAAARSHGVAPVAAARRATTVVADMLAA